MAGTQNGDSDDDMQVQQQQQQQANAAGTAVSSSNSGRPTSVLTPLQLYCFETSGYLLLRNALTTQELVRIGADMAAGRARASAAAEPPDEEQRLPAAVSALLTGHPVLDSALWELMDDPSFEQVQLQPPYWVGLLVLSTVNMWVARFHASAGRTAQFVSDEEGDDQVTGFFSRLNYRKVSRLLPIANAPLNIPSSRASPFGRLCASIHGCWGAWGSCRALLKNTAAPPPPRRSGCGSGRTGHTTRAGRTVTIVERGSVVGCVPFGSCRGRPPTATAARKRTQQAAAAPPRMRYFRGRTRRSCRHPAQFLP